MIKTLINQGQKIIEQDNIIKQLREENKDLRSEKDFAEQCKERLIRDILKIISEEEIKKTPYVFIIDKIKRELSANRQTNR